MTDLAVIVPTRSRPGSIGGILEAWESTDAFDVASLWFVVDSDDMQIDHYRACIPTVAGSRHGANMIVLPEWMPLVPKLNFVASEFAAEGEFPYIAFMGDDHLPRTNKWAHRLIHDHHRNPGWIWYGQDGFQNQNLPTWWSMDAEIVRRLGKMVPAPVQHLYCDNAVKTLGMAAGCLGYDETIMVEHMHPVVGKGKMDAQYERVNRAQQYQTDGDLFRSWVADGLERDAKILRNGVGG
jgi:hypothetical protein